MILYENRTEKDIHIKPRVRLTCPPHLHHDIELVYLTEGETEVEIDGECYTAKAGDTVMVFPNQIHGFKDKGNIRGYIFIVSPDVFSEYNTVFRNCKMKSPLVDVSEKKELERIFKIATDIFNSDKPIAYLKERTVGYMTVILSMVFASGELVEEKEVDLSSLKKILYYCDSHYAEPLSLAVLEKKLGFNRYYISHVFYDKIKIGFSDYINLLRINAAKSKLKHSDDRITDIALDSGFSSIRTFNRQFMSLCKVTPNEYREKHLSDITKKEPRN